jgi:hypothetical protein
MRSKLAAPTLVNKAHRVSFGASSANNLPIPLDRKDSVVQIRVIPARLAQTQLEKKCLSESALLLNQKQPVRITHKLSEIPMNGFRRLAHEEGPVAAITAMAISEAAIPICISQYPRKTNGATKFTNALPATPPSAIIK